MPVIIVNVASIPLVSNRFTVKQPASVCESGMDIIHAAPPRESNDAPLRSRSERQHTMMLLSRNTAYDSPKPPSSFWSHSSLGPALSVACVPSGSGSVG